MERAIVKDVGRSFLFKGPESANHNSRIRGRDTDGVCRSAHMSICASKRTNRSQLPLPGGVALCHKKHCVWIVTRSGSCILRSFIHPKTPKLPKGATATNCGPLKITDASAYLLSIFRRALP